MTKPVSTLRLKLNAPATPALVAAAAAMFRDIAAGYGQFTVTVENFDAALELRARDDGAVQQLDRIEHVLTTRTADSERNIAIAKGLATGFAQVDGEGEFFRNKRSIAKLDALLRQQLDRLSRTSPKRTQAAVRMAGAFEFTTTVLRVGRASADVVLRARVMLPHGCGVHECEVIGNEEAFFDAARRYPTAFVVRASGIWRETEDGPALDKTSVRLMSLRAKKASTGAAFLSEFAMTPEQIRRAEEFHEDES